MSVALRFALASLLLSAAAPALAFDLPPPVDAPEIDGPISDPAGWYFRGDIGYNVKLDAGDPSYKTFDAATQTTTSHGFDKSRMDRDPAFSAGVGYQFNDFLRSDVTLDYFKSTHNGKTGWSQCTVANDSATGYCRYDSQTVTSLSTMANAYVDLGTYWGLTPYAGAGAGVSYVKWSKVSGKRGCAYTNEADCNGLDFSKSTENGADSWRFTYALMAGASYDITDRMKLDLGYRFSQIGSGDMFSFNDHDEFNGAFGTKGKDDGFIRHEIRMGVRVTGW